MGGRKKRRKKLRTNRRTEVRGNELEGGGTDGKRRREEREGGREGKKERGREDSLRLNGQVGGGRWEGEHGCELV